jgi:nudix-type nucleoside diphosphatase (YffH/AdpP family)
VSDRVRRVAGELLSQAWGRLWRYRFEYRRADGTWQEQVREVYDRSHGAACLLHDAEADTVLLVRQFRFPLHISGQEGFAIEAPAGLLDGAEPEARMRAELMEETGYAARTLTRVADLVMSPGSVTEQIACFTGAYTRGDAEGEGGGHAHEGEDIEVLHLPLDRALAMIGTGEIRDAKTCFLLQHLALSLGRPLPSR